MWWWLLPPGICIMLVVSAVVFLGFSWEREESAFAEFYK
jgi:ABC-type dipeptide/oligopeptide/nickel transport system permease subunit